MVARRGDRNQIAAAIDLRRRGVGDGLCAVGIGRDGLNGRHRGRARGQRHSIDGLRRGVARDALAIDQDILQRVVRQQRHAEIERIGGGGSLVGRRHLDSGLARGGGRLRDLNGLLVLLSLDRNDWRGGGAVRERHIISIGGRAEVAQRLAIDADARQLSILARLTHELNLIRLLRLAVLGFDRDDGRRTIDDTIGNGDLAARQDTTRKSGRRTARIGQLARTTACLDFGKRGGVAAERIGLLVAAIGVEALPLLVVDINLLDIGRIDQLDIIDIERVARIEAAIGTEIRVVARRENDVHHGRHLVVEIENRDTDIDPIVVLLLLAPHTLGNLRHLLVGTALVAVQRLTDIALLVGAARIGTATVLALVLATIGRARPRIIKKVEILFGDIAARTANPHGHGVGAIRPADTALGAGTRLADGGKALDIDPRLAEREIARRRLRDTCRTDALVLHHHRGVARMARLLVRKIELETELRHVAGVPACGLCVAIERGAAPVLKTRIRQLLCLQRHNPQRASHCEPKGLCHPILMFCIHLNV